MIFNEFIKSSEPKDVKILKISKICPKTPPRGVRTYTNKRIIFTTLDLRHGKNVENRDFFVKIAVMGGTPKPPKSCFCQKFSTFHITLAKDYKTPRQ